MSCAKALMMLVPHGSEICPDQFVVPLAETGGSELTCRNTWLTPVSFTSASLAEPEIVTLFVVTRDSLAGMMIDTTGPFVSGSPPGPTRKRMLPTSLALKPDTAMR